VPWKTGCRSHAARSSPPTVTSVAISVCSSEGPVPFLPPSGLCVRLVPSSSAVPQRVASTLFHPPGSPVTEGGVTPVKALRLGGPSWKQLRRWNWEEWSCCLGSSPAGPAGSGRADADPVLPAAVPGLTGSCGEGTGDPGAAEQQELAVPAFAQVCCELPARCSLSLGLAALGAFPSAEQAGVHSFR